MEKTAIIDPTQKYRYLLTRVWDTTKPFIVFCMLNPSTADANTDDHTIRKCIGFSKRWGYGGFEVVNLFAYRATNPNDLYGIPDPYGPLNDSHILDAAIRRKMVVAAWGGEPIAKARGLDVEKYLRFRSVNLYHLGQTKSGAPKHPLTLPYSTPLVRW